MIHYIIGAFLFFHFFLHPLPPVHQIRAAENCEIIPYDQAPPEKQPERIDKPARNFREITDEFVAVSPVAESAPEEPEKKSPDSKKEKGLGRLLDISFWDNFSLLKEKKAESQAIDTREYKNSSVDKYALFTGTNYQHRIHQDVVLLCSILDGIDNTSFIFWYKKPLYAMADHIYSYNLLAQNNEAEVLSLFCFNFLDYIITLSDTAKAYGYTLKSCVINHPLHTPILLDAQYAYISSLSRVIFEVCEMWPFNPIPCDGRKKDLARYFQMLDFLVKQLEVHKVHRVVRDYQDEKKMELFRLQGRVIDTLSSLYMTMKNRIQRKMVKAIEEEFIKASLAIRSGS